jgi:hypothetical protein
MEVRGEDGEESSKTTLCKTMKRKWFLILKMRFFGEENDKDKIERKVERK